MAMIYSLKFILFLFYIKSRGRYDQPTEIIVRI